MRCLRCAIDYGPDEQFCRRCGRALSRPLGSKPTAEDAPSVNQQETQFFYTTTSPPPLQGAAQSTGEPVDWERPTAQGGQVGSPVLEPATRADAVPSKSPPSFDQLEPPSTARPIDPEPPSVSVQGDRGSSPLPLPIDLPLHSGSMLKRTTGSLSAGAAGGAPITSEAAASAGAPPRHVPDDFFGDEEDAEGSALLGPGFGKGSRAAGSDGLSLSGRGRRTAGVDEGRRNLRPLPLVIVIAVVLLALGGYAYTRQRAYNSDLATASGLAQQGRYPAAVVAYNKAITDWPFNSAAKSGLSAAQAAVGTAQAAAQAAAQAQAQFDSTRQSMFDAHKALIQQEVASRP